MNINRLYNKLCCVMQWNIGFSRGSIEQVIRQKECKLPFKWMPLNDSSASVADPFIFKDPSGKVKLIYEDFSMTDPAKYGKIMLTTLDKAFNAGSKKEVLDAGSHASYPFVFSENGKTFIIPETSHQRKVAAYEYDFANEQLVNESTIIDKLPLLDSTIFKHSDKYWLFATSTEQGLGHSRLFIYYSDSLFGNYKAHAGNPVKDNINGSRPAGNLIKVDGELYRPTQNCGQHYGESISINKITKLSENEFSEEFYFKISPDKNSKYNSGVHTINVMDDMIVIDGIRMIFMPLTKWKLFVQRKFKKGSA